MLDTLLFELNDKNRLYEAEEPEQTENRESEEARAILDKMSDSAKRFARSVNDMFSKMMRTAPNGFVDRAKELKNKINDASEKGDLENLIVGFNDFKNYMKDISDKFNEFKENALNETLAEEPFASMDKAIINDDKRNILGYLSEMRKEYGAIEQMNDATIDVLKSINNFDYAKVGARKPDLTKAVEELTNRIFDKDNTDETDKVLNELLKESKLDADDIDELKEDTDQNEKEMKGATIKQDISLSDIDRPKPLADAVNKFEKSLTDFDKNVLDSYYRGKDFGSLVYGNGNFVSGTCTKRMTPEAIVLLCGMALYKAFPHEGESVQEGDIDLRMESIKYDGGNSKAVIRYSIPEDSKGAEYDSSTKRSGKDIDSQSLEARINPGVEKKEGKGVVNLVIKTFDKDDPSTLVTNRGNNTSVSEFIKNLLGKDKKRSRW